MAAAITRKDRLNTAEDWAQPISSVIWKSHFSKVFPSNRIVDLGFVRALVEALTNQGAQTKGHFVVN